MAVITQCPKCGCQLSVPNRNTTIQCGECHSRIRVRLAQTVAAGSTEKLNLNSSAAKDSFDAPDELDSSKMSASLSDDALADFGAVEGGEPGSTTETLSTVDTSTEFNLDQPDPKSNESGEARDEDSDVAKRSKRERPVHDESNHEDVADVLDQTESSEPVKATQSVRKRKTVHPPYVAKKLRLRKNREPQSGFRKSGYSSRLTRQQLRSLQPIAIVGLAAYSAVATAAIIYLLYFHV